VSCFTLSFVARKNRLPLNEGAFYLFIAEFFATQIISGAKELVALL